MSSHRGTIALMGSGELTATMVEVHKELLARLPMHPRAVFLDTPAGFQLNVDQLSKKAVEYFRSHIQHSMAVASFKGGELTSPFDAEQAFDMLREAAFVLIGPGSPTYAVRNWRETSIPGILTRMVQRGGCLVAASAAALTVGRMTLPVYEIYKVGEDPHWVEGIDLLANFGFSLAVVPHWNNAEGGTHDTRFCYMGEKRFERLQSLLPEDVVILGLDEHTACLMDFEAREAVVRGIGRVTLRRRGVEITFAKGERFPLDLLHDEGIAENWREAARPSGMETPGEDRPKESLWERVHSLEASFHLGIERHDARGATGALLELDRLVWEVHAGLEGAEVVSQIREILREMIVRCGVELESPTSGKTAFLDRLVTEMLALRERFRQERKWQEADGVRECLLRANIVVEDTREGPRWMLRS